MLWRAAVRRWTKTGLAAAQLFNWRVWAGLGSTLCLLVVTALLYTRHAHPSREFPARLVEYPAPPRPPAAPRLLCLVLTSPANYRARAVHVAATWGRRCHKLIFISDQACSQHFIANLIKTVNMYYCVDTFLCLLSWKTPVTTGGDNK